MKATSGLPRNCASLWGASYSPLGCSRVAPVTICGKFKGQTQCWD